MILAIFCAVGADSWFARDKAGFDEGLLPVPLIGLLVVILALLQIVLIAVALYGFNQDWHVEEERPIGSGEDYGAGAPPDERRPAAARLTRSPSARRDAGGGTRTHKPVRAIDFESIAYASSATPAPRQR